jgi:hypothetical protein
MKLSFEIWEPVFNNRDINTSFNQFLNIFLRHLYASFPLPRNRKYTQNSWITVGIINSCRKKRELYGEVKKSKNHKLLIYYKKYCKILTKVINLAKKMTNEKQIKNSKNKIRTTWNVINREVHKEAMKENIQILNIDSKNYTNYNTIVEVFNKYFSGIVNTIHKQIKENCNNGKTKSTCYMDYMSMGFRSTFPNIQIKKTQQ